MDTKLDRKLSELLALRWCDQQHEAQGHHRTTVVSWAAWDSVVPARDPSPLISTINATLWVLPLQCCTQCWAWCCRTQPSPPAKLENTDKLSLKNMCMGTVQGNTTGIPRKRWHEPGDPATGAVNRKLCFRFHRGCLVGGPSSAPSCGGTYSYLWDYYRVQAGARCASLSLGQYAQRFCLPELNRLVFPFWCM